MKKECMIRPMCAGVCCHGLEKAGVQLSDHLGQPALYGCMQEENS